MQYLCSRAWGYPRTVFIEEGELFKIGANIRVRFGNDGYLVWTSPDSGSADFRRTFNGSEGVNRVTRVEFEVEE
jgi:hypothetical protein